MKIEMVKAHHIARFGCVKARGGYALVTGPLDGEDDVALPDDGGSQGEQGDHQYELKYQ